MTKEQILAELTRNRATIARDYGALRTELDFKAKLNRLVRRKPLAWFGGATALGWLLAGPKTKKRTVTKYVKATDRHLASPAKKTVVRGGVPLLFGLFRLALPILKPTLSAYATKWLADFAGRAAK
jgi:hypothetical protein